MRQSRKEEEEEEGEKESFSKFPVSLPPTAIFSARNIFAKVIFFQVCIFLLLWVFGELRPLVNQQLPKQLYMTQRLLMHTNHLDCQTLSSGRKKWFPSATIKPNS
jgi:hypothetical protein